MMLTARDTALLQGLALFRVATLAQLREYYLDRLARPLVQRRLSKLKNFGWLRAFPFGENGALAWTLTAQAARSLGRPERAFLRPPNRNSLEHDLAVTEIGLTLARLKLLQEWVGAHEMERVADFHGEHVPDAVFRLKVNGRGIGPIGLEVENTLKTKARLADLLEQYRRLPAVSDLWFFWRRAWMHKALARHLGHEHPKIWMAEKSLDEGVALRLKEAGGMTLDLEAFGLAPDTGSIRGADRQKARSAVS